jgi:hypothetical protein
MKVESNIPMPARYPFAKMNVGDSFLIPENVSRSSAAVAAYRYGLANRKKFVTRKTSEGHRIWRVE